MCKGGVNPSPTKAQLAARPPAPRGSGGTIGYIVELASEKEQLEKLLEAANEKIEQEIAWHKERIQWEWERDASSMYIVRHREQIAELQKFLSQREREFKSGLGGQQRRDAQNASSNTSESMARGLGPSIS